MDGKKAKRLCERASDKIHVNCEDRGKEKKKIDERQHCVVRILTIRFEKLGQIEKKPRNIWAVEKIPAPTKQVRRARVLENRPRAAASGRI